MDFADVCVVEEQVEAIFYHKRRDFQRMHLRWRQNMEAIYRTGYGEPYPEPVCLTIEQIRKEIYQQF